MQRAASNGDDGFTFVTRSRRSRKKGRERKSNNNTDEDSPCSDDILKRLEAARQVISCSDQMVNVINALQRCGEILKSEHFSDNIFSEIVCYGLGKFAQHRQSLYQLALLLQLKSVYNVEVSIFDPVFSSIEENVLRIVDLNLINENEEGKRKANNSTLFFLPHCPREILNNLLWRNWGSTLTNCIILGNKHSEVITNNLPSSLKDYWFVNKITPAIEEIEVPNVFHYQDIFNDMAVHIFPPKKLESLPISVWTYREMPLYKDQTGEFIDSKH